MEAMFKAYIDMIVEKAFRKGVEWELDPTIPIEEAIKAVQDEILNVNHK